MCTWRGRRERQSRRGRWIYFRGAFWKGDGEERVLIPGVLNCRKGQHERERKLTVERERDNEVKYTITWKGNEGNYDRKITLNF